MGDPTTKVDHATKLNLITRNLQEVLGKDRLEDILKQRDLEVYWGTATTGRPHIGYFVPMTKIADFLRADCKVTILFADLHAFLDYQKAPWDLLQLRTEYYEALIKATLESIGVPIAKLKFVRGTDYQLSKQYTLDMYRLTSITTEHDAKKAGAEVVKGSNNPLLSGMLYPLLQALDEHYLNCDAQFGGVDQRKIFTFAEEYLPKIGYGKRIHLMNPMVPSLSQRKLPPADPAPSNVGEATSSSSQTNKNAQDKSTQTDDLEPKVDFKKMSSSEDSKIDLLDSTDSIKRKISKVFCEEGNIEDNTLLTFVKMVLFPLHRGGNENYQFEVKRKFGGDIAFKTFEELEKTFAEKQMHPGDLKNAVTSSLDTLLAPIRKRFEDPSLIALTARAYPDAPTNNPVNNNNNNNNNNSNKNIKKDNKPSTTTSKPEAASAQTDLSRVDLRVGIIRSVKKHPDADSLYVEEIDIGEAKNRTIVSGLVRFIPIEEMVNRRVVVVANLKPAPLRGITSFGMVLAASNADRSQVELVEPPEGAAPGERIQFSEEHKGTPDAEINPKKKILDKVLAELKTSDSCVANFSGIPFTTSKGVCTVKSLKGASIS